MDFCSKTLKIQVPVVPCFVSCLPVCVCKCRHSQFLQERHPSLTEAKLDLTKENYDNAH